MQHCSQFRLRFQFRRMAYTKVVTQKKPAGAAQIHLLRMFLKSSVYTQNKFSTANPYSPSSGCSEFRTSAPNSAYSISMEALQERVQVRSSR